MSKKSKKEEISAIDEVIELKFGKDAGLDPKKRTEIFNFLDQLYEELDEFQGDNNDDHEDEHHNHAPFDREMVTAINDDDTPEGMIPFVVIRKEKTTVDVKCPYCNNEDKFFLSNFKKNQYKDYECPNCHKKSLAKLDFIANIKIYVEHE